MDNLFEILLPLIFVIIYFFGSIFSRNKEEQPERPPLRRQRPRQAEPVSEEVRRVQEEIRRKIAERREEQPASQPRETPAATRRMEDPASRMPAPPVSPPPLAPTPMGFPSEAEEALAAQIRAVRETEEQARQAQAQAAASINQIKKKYQAPVNRSREFPGQRSVQHLPRGRYMSFLRSSLADPQALRKSIVLSEVFGTPVGARRGGHTRPSWEL